MNQFVKEHKVPRIPKKILRWYCKPDLLEDIEGDIEEDFNKRYTRQGKHIARLYYLLDVIRFFRPFAVKNILKIQINSMFKLNTRIAFRNLAKHKLYSFINIAGLGIGIAACLIIAHYVIFQMSYDRFHENADRLYRVQKESVRNNDVADIFAYTSLAMGPALMQDIPEISKMSRLHPYYDGAVVSRVVDSVYTNSFREEEIYYVDPDFLEMFGLNVLQGDLSSALDDPNSIVITEAMRIKYFGNENRAVVGQILNVNGDWESGDAKVTAVISDLPGNTHFKFKFLLPIAKVLTDSQYQSESAAWGWSNFYTYVMLNDATSEQAAEVKMADLMYKYQGERLRSNGMDVKLSIQNVTELHLRGEILDAPDGLKTPGNINSVYFMIVIALFILVIAWINFINLSTAKASERGLEVGIKKAMGAEKRQLISQFLVESFWVNLIAVVIAILFTYAAMPYLSEAIGSELSVNLSDPIILMALAGLLVAGPMLVGIYPALVMSSFKTVNALKGKFISKNSSTYLLRRGLVVFQFIISTLLIAGTFAVSKQLNYMQSRGTGMELSQILAIKGPQVNVSLAGFQSFKNTMSQYATVESFSTSRSVPGAGYNWGSIARRSGTEESENKHIDVTWIDETFIETMGMELITGRQFEFSQEQIDHGMIINEACLETFGLGSAEEALNEKLILGGDTIFVRGVVKNHNWKSLHSDYTPATFLYQWASVDFFTMRVNPANLKETISKAEAQFMDDFPGNPLEYYFLDDFFNRQYQADLAFANLFKAFSVFAILAACMGLFGLASYSVVQKAKEIGIRRVLGATGLEITFLFSKRYLILMLIANVIAIPIAYYGIDQWLDDFAFSINISAELFLIPVALLLVIAFFTVSFQTLRAALVNPVKNLRSE